MMDDKDKVNTGHNIEDKELINNATSKVVDIIDDYFKLTFENLMNKYN